MYALLAPANVDKNWMTIAPWIAQAIEGSRVAQDLEQIKTRAMNGSMQIWVGAMPKSKNVSLVLVTEAILIDEVPMLVLRMLAGVDIDECLPDMAMIENWATNKGFHSLQIWGRKGWERKLKPLGFRHEYTILSKVLDKGLH